MKKSTWTPTDRESSLLNTIWRWKVLNFRVAERLCYEGTNPWTLYRNVKNLSERGLITTNGGHNFNHDVLQLTKLGFDFIKHDLGYLREQRFATQSLAHDYWAMAFQLGEFVETPVQGVEFLSEQEIQVSDESLLPEWVPKSRDHIPDGFTCITEGNKKSVFAIEVELNLKPLSRYDRAGYYFDSLDSNTDVVLWLGDGVKLLKHIHERISSARLRRIDIHHYILLDDFKKNGWQATSRAGKYNGQSVWDIYLANSCQTDVKTIAKSKQNVISDLYLNFGKSPQNLER